MDVYWVPADALARMVLDLAHGDHEGVQTYDLIKPHNRDWMTLVPSIQKVIGGKLVLSKEWREQLKPVDGNDKAEVAEKPASKILDVQAALSSGTGGLKYATANGISAS